MNDKPPEIQQPRPGQSRLVDVIPAEHRGLSILTSVPLFIEAAREVGITDPESITYFSCAWNFCRIAKESIETYPKDVVLEGETDATSTLRQALEGQMRLYRIEDIEKLMRFMPLCRTLAFRRTLPWDSRFQAWLDSGGHAYNILTRDPDARNV